MKKLTILLIGLIVSLTIACKKHQPEYDKDITLVIDRTDKMTAYPTAQGNILVLDFEGHPWQAVRVTVTNISATDINNSTTITLAGESEWMGNLDIRKAKIKRFKQKLSALLTIACTATTCDHSIIYRSIAKASNSLAKCDATERWLVVASDLKENSSINFYSARVVDSLRLHPATMRKRLEQTEPLSTLTGVKVVFLYNPASYKDNISYMALATFYQGLFTVHHATTYLDSKFTL